MTQDTGSVVVIGQNVWAHGHDLAEAKKIFRKHGGRLQYGYTIVEFSDGLTFEGVDQMGAVHWKDALYGETGKVREPNITEVQPRRDRLR